MKRVELTEPQTQVYNLQCEHPLFVGGYGSGKTHSLICNSLRDALSFGRVKVGSYCPTYDLLKLNLIPRLEEILIESGIRFHLNKSDHIFTLQNGSQIIMRSMDNPQRIVAYEVFRSHVDEIDTIPRKKATDIWNKIIARNRQTVTLDGNKLSNTVSAYTTPDYGFSSFTYHRWKKQQSENYQYVRAPTFSNPFVDDGYVDKLKETYTDELIEAYINGEWCNFTEGVVYKKYDRIRNRSKETYHKGETISVGMDFNVRQMAAVIYVIRGDKEWHAVKEKTDGADTPAMIEWIKQTFPGSRVIVYPDASGGSNNSTDASKSDISLLKQAGFRVLAKKKNPLVKDRIICTNKRFEILKLFVNDTECPVFAECLEQQGYGPDGKPDKTSGLDHANDAGTYPIAYQFPISKPVHSGMTAGGY